MQYPLASSIQNQTPGINPHAYAKQVFHVSIQTTPTKQGIYITVNMEWNAHVLIFLSHLLVFIF